MDNFSVEIEPMYFLWCQQSDIIHYFFMCSHFTVEGIRNHLPFKFGLTNPEGGEIPQALQGGEIVQKYLTAKYGL